jgi:hypothetical protein
MGLESGTFVEDLVITNPLGTDDKRQGDDHLTLIKKVLKNTIKRGTKAFFVPTLQGVVGPASVTILESDENKTFLCDTTAGPITLTLPVLDSTRYGWRCYVIKNTLSANPVFLTSSGGVNGFSKVRRSIEWVPTRVEWVGLWTASRQNGVPVGSVVEFYGTTLPNGHLWADGTGYSGTDFVELSTVLGGAVKPDRRGTAAVGRDDLGGVPALRINSLGSLAVTLKGIGGAQSVTLVQGNLPASISLGNTLGWTQSGTGTGTFTQTGTATFNGSAANFTCSGAAAFAVPSTLNSPTNVRQFDGGIAFGVLGQSAFTAIDTYTPAGSVSGVTGTVTGVSVAGSITGTISLAGSSTPISLIQPTTICNAIVVAE